MCSLGIEPTTFYTANTMLYHWVTGTLIKQQNTEKITHYSWLKNFNTVYLEISLYSVLFLHLFISFLKAPAENIYCTWK